MKKSLLLGLLAAPFLNAGEFDPQSIPADAQWYLHANVEKLRETTTGKTIVKAIKKEHGQDLADAEIFLGFDLIRDVADVSLFGNGKMDNAAIIFRGEINRRHLEKMIVDADHYQSNLYQGEAIHSWRDKGKNQNAAFHGDTLVVVSERPELVMLTLDVLAKRKPHLESTKPNPESAVMMGTANIEGLNLPKDKGSKIVKKAKSLRASISEVGDRLRVDLAVETKEDKTAARLQKIVEGLIAFGMMAEPKIEELNIEHGSSVTGNQVLMHLTIPIEDALALIKEIT